MEALNTARRELPDAVLVDLMLPDLDGFSLCEILRSQPSTSQVPIIVVSALDGEYVRSRGIQAGVACCFKKPVDMKVLGDSIRSNYELHLESMRSEETEDTRRRKSM
jgi:DNA-binding response OmpR family regulator